MSSTKTYCPGCGNVTGPSDSFCMSCGMDVRHLSPVEEAVEEEVAVVGSHASADEMAVELVADSYTPTPVPAGIDFPKWFKPSEDLQQGQVVIIAARWVLVAAGLLLAAWNPAELGELRVQIVLILGLAVANFFLHTRVLMGRPIHATVVYAASAVDIAVVSLIIIAGDGFASGAFVFYFPVLLALSVAFKTEATIVFTGAAIAVYGVIATASVITEGDDWATLIARLMMIAGVAVCGNIYWRIERDRRRAAEEAREELKLQVSQATSSD